jgi:hypothetical protein
MVWETIGRDHSRGRAAGFLWLVMAALLLWMCLRDAWRGEYFWAGCWLHMHLLSLAWAHPIARYLMPVAPFLVAGMALALTQFARQFEDRLLRWGTLTVGGVLLISVVYVNAFIFRTELRIASRADPLTVHDGGVYYSLRGIAHWLSIHAPPDAAIAITHTRNNGGRGSITRGYMTMLHWMMVRPVRILPNDLGADPRRRDLHRWLRENHVSYYIWQPPIRVSLYSRAALNAPDLNAYHEEFGFQLFHVTGSGLERVYFRNRSQPIRTVPGLAQE